jgi:hypothetical protein
VRRVVLSILGVALIFLALSTASSEAHAAGSASVTVVQALPGATVAVRIDGRVVAEGSAVGDVLGPVELAAGDHDVRFEGDGVDVASTLATRAGAATDVVLHLPAEVGGDPVVHSYDAPTGPIGPDKARVLLAHTATVAPADVEVDGETVFTNIANGEFADADVPAGTIEVALLPSGSAAAPILGPLDVALDAGTLSMIYAYGNPRSGGMSVISHTTRLASDGSVRPARIDTGSAGLVTTPVTTFGTPGPPHLATLLTEAWGVLVAVGAVGTLGARRLRRTRLPGT